jgi:hypothetical protein
MSAYTSGNNAPTLMAQAPNRKGNQSKHTPTGTGGATGVTRPQGSTTYSGPHQGAAKASGSATAGRGQKVMVSMPKPYCSYAENTGYMDKDRTNYLK